MVRQVVKSEMFWPDRFAAGLGLLCAIHCLSMPLLIGILPLLGLSWLASETAEVWVSMVLLSTALVGMIWGLKRHGDLRVVAVFIVSMILLGAGQILHSILPTAHYLTVLGSIVVAGAHVFNGSMNKIASGTDDENCCDH